MDRAAMMPAHSYLVIPAQYFPVFVDFDAALMQAVKMVKESVKEPYPLKTNMSPVS